LVFLAQQIFLLVQASGHRSCSEIAAVIICVSTVPLWTRLVVSARPKRILDIVMTATFRTENIASRDGLLAADSEVTLNPLPSWQYFEGLHFNVAVLDQVQFIDSEIKFNFSSCLYFI
jgi:hypothetical protein